MNPCKVLAYTTRNIVQFPTNNSGYIPDYIHILHDMIYRNIFQKQPTGQGDMVLDYRPWKKLKQRKIEISDVTSRLLIKQAQMT
jgi:hypothetical protein